MSKVIICPKCKGRGITKESDSYNYGKFGFFISLGVLNAIDAVFSETWEVECLKCEGKGKLLL
jgi:DnaJ-class molecular chaperone